MPALLLALVLGSGAYLLGKGSGEDLGEAERLGRVAGVAHGKAKGTRRGARVGRSAGLARGFDATYETAYRRAYRQAFDEAGLAAPARREIKVSLP